MPKKIIFHIDMDAFYVSVECLLNPALKGKPVVVGTDHPRSVISAASYEARKYGVFSAMSSVKAKQLCPNLIFVFSSRKVYADASKTVMEIIHTYSPLVEQAGIDEAYLDATGLGHIYKSPYIMAKQLQAEIYEKSGGLTSSIGIAPSKFLAKIASDYNKPFGITEIKEEDVADFLKNLDLYKIPFVGKKFLQELHNLGIYTAGQAQAYSHDFYLRRFGKQGEMLYSRIHGIDNSPIVPYTEPKSESAECTFEKDTQNKEILKQALKKHAQRVGEGLRKYNKKAGTVTLKIKYSDFTQITRQIPLVPPSYATISLFEAACYLLDKENLIKPVRLVGLAASQFHHKEKIQQASLIQELQNSQHSFKIDTEITKKREKIDKTLDNIKMKYGKNLFKG